MSKQRTRLPALTTLDTIKEALDVILGRRGEKLDSAVTFRDLEGSGAFKASLRSDGMGLSPVFPSQGEGGVDPATWVPGGPEGFEATAMLGGIFIEWDWPPKFGLVGYTEVYRGLSNDATKREFLTVVDGLTYFDQIDGEDQRTYFYWIRFRSTGDKVGPYAGPVSAISVPSAEVLIDRLEGQINESLLAEHLRERIDLIDGEGGLVQQVSEQGSTFANQITQVQTQTQQNYSALQQTISSRFNQVTNKVESIYSLRINNNGRVSGFGLSDDGYESVFGVEADRFYVSGSGLDNRPFMVSGGRVYIRDAVIQDGAIDNAKIGNGAITNAKIANASIDDLKVSSAGISFAKIKDVRVSSAMIDNGAITNAKIAEATITGAKIATATIGTLELAGEAVTIPVSSSGGYWANVSFYAPVSMQAVVLGVFTQGAGRDGVRVGLSHNNSEFRNESPRAGTTGAMAGTVWLGQGNHTFSIYTSSSVGNMNCSLTVLGVKR